MSSNRRSPHITKHSLRLREGDFATIQAAFPSIGANAAIRRYLSAWVDNIRGNAIRADIEVNLEEPKPNE